MNREEVEERLRKILKEDFRVAEEKIRPEATFRGDLGLDSMDVVDFVLLLEKDLGVDAKLESYRDLRTFRDVVTFMTDKAAASRT
jgi:acyl carrier protein